MSSKVDQPTTVDLDSSVDEKPAQAKAQPTFRAYIQSHLERLRSGDLGLLPIIFGLVLIAFFFQWRNSNFITPRNLSNLIVQMAAIATIGYGIVFVLLIGEIDLSVSYISAMAGAILVISMLPDRGLPIWWGVVDGEFVVTQTVVLQWWLAIPVAVLIAAAIGFLQGVIINFVGVPAFIVTLAGFLVWSGMVLITLGRGGTLRMSDPFINGIANTYLPDWAGWVLLATVVGIFVFATFANRRYRQKQNLVLKPFSVILFETGLVAVLGAIAVAVLNAADTPAQDRGVPLVGVFLLLFLVVLTFIAERTTFGRYIYATGGNQEAARRAGIKVLWIRTWAFTISGLMSGFGGIILVSRLRSISTEAGGGDLLLNAIAAAVIGGTSLFGGRGKVQSALFGALVIGSLANGMGLLGWSAGVQSVVTGIVLVIAVLLDSLSRRAQKRAGLA
jgi:D-xylose transport system permease protein